MAERLLPHPRRFSEEARLDDGAMWPTSWALTSLADAELDAITALVKRAAG